PRGGEGTVLVGGVREPFIARLLGKIPAGTIQSEPAMAIDLLPTIARLVGGELPKQPIDGQDVGPLLRCEPEAKNSDRTYFFYYGKNELQAVRRGRWKLILPHTYRTMNGQQPGKDGRP